MPFEILLKNDTKNKAKLDYTNLNWFGKNLQLVITLQFIHILNSKIFLVTKAHFHLLALVIQNLKTDKSLLSKKMDINKVMLRGIADPDEIRKLSELPELGMN